MRSPATPADQALFLRTVYLLAALVADGIEARAVGQGWPDYGFD
jgi:hypothetical protein